MSIGVLRGEPHTHYDDIESLLYVLVLFFFSYQGPLPKEALRKAMVQGFTQPVGAARLSHVTPWPDMLKGWARGSLRDMSDHKYADIAPAFVIFSWKIAIHIFAHDGTLFRGRQHQLLQV